jgi:hypothetical protein
VVEPGGVSEGDDAGLVEDARGKNGTVVVSDNGQDQLDDLTLAALNTDDTSCGKN